MKKALTFDDVLLVPKYSDIASRKDVSLFSASKKCSFFLNLPVFSSNMDTITESEMCKFMDSKGGMGILHRFMSIEKNVEEFKKHPNCFVSIGTTSEEKERYLQLYAAGARKFCIDVAHGHSKSVRDAIGYLSSGSMKNNPTIIMAGNVATYEGAKFLENAGANIIKVGIGGGSVCSTRIKTGFGIPQLEAIRECSKVGVSIVADGGIRTPGDIVKALAMGADYVMIGSLLAGTHYTPGEPKDRIEFGGEGGYIQLYDRKIKTYRGMASLEANKDHYGGLSDWKTAEGISVSVPYKDEKETNAIIQDIIGGLRSGLSYCGAKNIRELQEKVEFIEISNNGLLESHPHKK